MASETVAVLWARGILGTDVCAALLREGVDVRALDLFLAQGPFA